MCWTCGGRCLLCGEPSTTIWESLPEIQMYACEEHVEEVGIKADFEINRIRMREMAFLN